MLMKIVYNIDNLQAIIKRIRIIRLSKYVWIILENVEFGIKPNPN